VGKIKAENESYSLDSDVLSYDLIQSGRYIPASGRILLPQCSDGCLCLAIYSVCQNPERESKRMNIGTFKAS
jgi:hypothetical protein